MNKAQKRKLCSGCRNNRYNMGKGYQESGIDAPVTCSECWNLKDARVISKRVVSISQRPPFTNAKQKVLSCWSCPGYATVD
jgi:hypothetical protein